MKITKVIIILLFNFLIINTFGQMTGPEDPGGDPVGETPLGGGAPLDGGTILLLSLALVYGGKKTLQNKNHEGEKKHLN